MAKPKRQVTNLIDFDNKYEFILLENLGVSKNDFKHPAMDYFLLSYDLSVNLTMKLKWIKWGFFFLKSLSEDLKNTKRDNYNFFGNVIQNDLKLIKKENHVLLLDNFIIENEKQMMEIYEDMYKDILNENWDIKFKLKLNCDEFVILDDLYIPILTTAFRH